MEGRTLTQQKQLELIGRNSGNTFLTRRGCKDVSKVSKCILDTIETERDWMLSKGVSSIAANDQGMEGGLPPSQEKSKFIGGSSRDKVSF
jgi:hypothetical protein